MNNPLFSVILPIYNMEALLERCLDSILAQTYTNLEIILVNDGSVDATARICDRYAANDRRFKVIHKKNTGVSEARNSGIDIATGDYLSFVDPDDWVEPDMYARLVKIIRGKAVDIVKFNAYKNRDMIGDVGFIGTFEGDEKQKQISLMMLGPKYFGELFMMGVPWMYIFKRNVINTHSIKFDSNLQRCEDRLFTITTIMKSDSIAIVDDILYHYEVNLTSLSNKYDSLRWEQELYFMAELKKVAEDVLPDDLQPEIPPRMAYDYFLRAMVTMDHLFFSNNNLSFSSKYKKTKEILNEPRVRCASKNFEGVKTNLNKTIIQKSIIFNLPLFLTIYNITIGFIRKYR